MNIALVLLHVDCPTICEETPTPPRLLLTHALGMITGTCPGCGQQVTVDITPVAVPAAATVT